MKRLLAGLLLLAVVLLFGLWVASLDAFTRMKLFEDCIVGGFDQCRVTFFQIFGLPGLILLGVIAVVLIIVFDVLRDLLKSSVEPRDGQMSERGIHPQGATRRYLENFINDNRYFGFKGIEELSLKASARDLDRTYIALRLIPQLDHEEAKQRGAAAKRALDAESLPLRGLGSKSQTFTLAQTIHKTRQRRLTIIGDAGSGKSALLQWAGLSVARVRLRHGHLSHDQHELITVIRGRRWASPPVPILIPLREFANYCRENLKRAPDDVALLEFIYTLGERRYPSLKLPANFFERQLKGRCLLMLDGMDEVAQNDREAMRAAVNRFACLPQHRQHHVIVTSRPSTAHLADTLVDFRRADIQPLLPEQRKTLINLWCGVVYGTPDEANRRAADLLRRIEDERVRAIADTPLMVNIFALTYYYNRELPSQRAELYEFAIRTLLTDLHHPDASSVQDWGGFDLQARRDHLALLAFILHDEKMNNVRADELLEREALWRRFGAEKEPAQRAAQDFLELVARRGGLLRQDGNRYDFYIRRFREFLTARWLAKKLEGQWSEVFQRHIEDDQWEEPFLLGAGFLAYDNLDKAEKYMRQLLESQRGLSPTRAAYAVALTGVALADLLSHADETVKQVFATLKQSLPPRMLSVFERNPPLIRLPLRYRLGLALGAVGDPRLTPTPALPRDKKHVAGEGVDSPLPSRTSTGEGRGVGAILPALIAIPAGPFHMGTSDDETKILEAQDAAPWDDERPEYTVYVSEFEIGKYPVTNAEYAVFLKEAKGYEQERFWSDEGKRWLRGEEGEPDLSWLPTDELKKQWREYLARRPKEKRHQPFFWDDPKWKAPNLPVVGVTWFEAEAYCKWLSEVTGQHFRLPTEAEWEKSARFDLNPRPPSLQGKGESAPLLVGEGKGEINSPLLAGKGQGESVSPLLAGEGSGVRLWPWGDTWDKDKCNSSESGFNATTPVGMYPDGASPLGALDMVGNVWEWCRDNHDENLYRQRVEAGQEVRDPVHLTGSAERVLRGGSWNNPRRNCRSAYRSWANPMNFPDNVGFRLARAPV